VGLFADRCNEHELVKTSWPSLKEAFEDFSRSNWRLDPVKGDIFANRYLASLLSFSRIAEQVGEAAISKEAAAKAELTTQALIAWWKRAGETRTLRTFNSSSELDPFIGKGDAIWLAVAPHRHKLALFQDLTPEIAGILRSQAPESVASVWQTFSSLCPTWALLGEERQVHFGENFVDPPDFALSGFRALAWLRQAPRDTLACHVDLPVCHADLYYLLKLTLTLEEPQ
jgi:hypothetical protein